MKKAKMMLIAIAVLATVGGALAFKATKAFGFEYCIRTLAVTNGVTTTCTNEINDFIFKQPGQTQGLVTYYYTTKVDASCLDGERCTTTTTFAPEL